ncbi:hypothetical protein LVD15_20550 [Fulvivirga maritima]|uniref:hypothetical protein n=1 Tax=Fulvivirga maritima TaxID=2904247 RepID=UPI001F1D7CA3|nr:hypothetical protein [Fulvivirga maritima]UII25673.1 hypothetical protein LVD15_20550 [Fulvivirga maritima]
MTTMISICGFVVAIMVVILVISIRQQGKIKKMLKALANQHNFEYKEVKKEYNLLIKSLFGGTGV